MKYLDNEIYHVFNRGAHKSKLFFNEGNYEYCIQLLTKYISKHSVDLLAYCLMSNHYHLLLRQRDGGSISRYIQTIFNAYSQAVNIQQGWSGTLFQGRAKSTHIDNDESLIAVVCYIHLNPVVAGLVSLPEEWKFSDYCNWVNDPENDTRARFFADGSEYRNYVAEFISDRSNLAKVIINKS